MNEEQRKKDEKIKRKQQAAADLQAKEVKDRKRAEIEAVK